MSTGKRQTLFHCCKELAPKIELERLKMDKARFVFASGLVLLLVLTACSTQGTQDNIQTAQPPNLTSATAVSVEAEAVLTANLATPTPTNLELAPQNCSKTVPIDTITGGYRMAGGGYPVWATSFRGPPLTLALKANDRHTQYGWAKKLLFIISADYSEPITLKGGNIANNLPLWMAIGSVSTSTSPTIKAEQGLQTQKGARDFPSNVYIPYSGCYYLEAYSATGQQFWHIVFGAGLDN